MVVRPDPTISVTPEASEICIGGTSLLTAAVTGGSAALTIQWESSPNGVSDWTVIGGANSVNYTAQGNIEGTTYYRAYITDPSLGCEDPVSNVVSVIVKPDATVTIAPDLTEVCVGGLANISATITNGSTGFSV